jgi:hypothetical protein
MTHHELQKQQYDFQTFNTLTKRDQTIHIYYRTEP